MALDELDGLRVVRLIYVKSAAHFIDGASGNFSGRLSRYPAGRLVDRGDQSACNSDQTYTKV